MSRLRIGLLQTFDCVCVSSWVSPTRRVDDDDDGGASVLHYCALCRISGAKCNGGGSGHL